MGDRDKLQRKVAKRRFRTMQRHVLVYPEGTWYANVTPAVAERIVEQHLRDGEPPNAVSTTMCEVRQLSRRRSRPVPLVRFRPPR